MAAWPIRVRGSPLLPKISSTSPSWSPRTTRCIPIPGRRPSGCRSGPPGTGDRRSPRRSTRTTSWPPPRPSASTGPRTGSTGRCTWAPTRTRFPSRPRSARWRCSPPTTCGCWSTPAAGTRRRPSVSRAILAHNAGPGPRADGIVVTPSHNPPSDGGFKYNPPDGGPAGTDITSQIQDRANDLLADGLKGVRRIPYARAAAADTTGKYDFLGRLPVGPSRGDRPARHQGSRGAHRRRPAGRGQRGLLGRDRRLLRPGPDRGQPRRRRDVPVHDAGLGRQDPDGLLVAVRHGQPDRPPARVHGRDRERHRRRPARHRHPRRRADEPQPLPRRRHRLPVPGP